MATLRTRTVSRANRAKSRTIVSCATLTLTSVAPRVTVSIDSPDEHSGDTHYTIEMSLDEWRELNAKIETAAKYGLAFAEFATERATGEHPDDVCINDVWTRADAAIIPFKPRN